MARDDDPSFGRELFAFLRELAEHNEREWFQANKGRYEQHVKEPALAFVEDMEHRLPEKGSVFRIYRDIRFSKDKSPYKTHVGIAFGRLYLHLEPGHVFMGAGVWHPDSAALKRIRTAIVADPAGWRDAVASAAPDWSLGEGERLKRAPQGFPADHPLIEDLKRRSFAVVSRLQERDATRGGFLDVFEARARAARPFLDHLERMVGA